MRKDVQRDINRVKQALSCLRITITVVRATCLHKDVIESGWGLLYCNSNNTRICKDCGIEETAKYSGGGGFDVLRPDIQNSYDRLLPQANSSDEFYSYRIPYVNIEKVVRC